mmetsp:Transcript_15474/g.31557  ORF Transcript_15474/g.31557 Transcript_15474/m.31557 type:complete len:84 (-) Transcript_15474:164-415(-)
MWREGVLHKWDGGVERRQGVLVVKPRVGVIGVIGVDGVDGVVFDTSLRWRVRGGGGVVKREYGDILRVVINKSNAGMNIVTKG